MTIKDVGRIEHWGLISPQVENLQATYRVYCRFEADGEEIKGFIPSHAEDSGKEVPDLRVAHKHPAGTGVRKGSNRHLLEEPTGVAPVPPPCGSVLLLDDGPTVGYRLPKMW